MRINKLGDELGDKDCINCEINKIKDIWKSHPPYNSKITITEVAKEIIRLEKKVKEEIKIAMQEKDRRDLEDFHNHKSLEEMIYEREMGLK